MASEDLSPSILRHFDIDLQKFYLEALNKELDVLSKQNARDIKSALKEVVEAYKKPAQNIQNVKSIRFDSSAKRCAYVLKHSPCFTSAVGRHFLALVRSRPNILDACVARGEVNLCCLGGGPASDAVGACRILSALHRPLWIKSRKLLKVRVTVVDINEDWTVTAKNVLHTLNDNPELLGIEGIELFFSFFKADLLRPIEARLKQVMEEADVITMVYFLSAVNKGRDQIESLLMVKAIMKHIREGSTLFFLDSAMDVHYNQMNSAAESRGDMTRVHGPCIEEFHTLSIDSVKRFLELYKRQFGKFLCLTNCFVSSCAWQKDCKFACMSSLSRSRSEVLLKCNVKERSVGCKSISSGQLLDQTEKCKSARQFAMRECDFTSRPESEIMLVVTTSKCDLEERSIGCKSKSSCQFSDDIKCTCKQNPSLKQNSNCTIVEQSQNGLTKSQKNNVGEYRCPSHLFLNNSNMDMSETFINTAIKRMSKASMLERSMDYKSNTACQLLLDKEKYAHKSHYLFINQSQLDKYGLFLDTMPNLNNITLDVNRSLDCKLHSKSTDQLLSEDCTFDSQYEYEPQSEMSTPNYNLMSGRPIESMLDECVCKSMSYQSNKSETLERLMMDEHVLEDELLWRKSQRQAVSGKTSRMLQFRAQIKKLLTDVFDNDVESEMFQDVDLLPDDAFDSLMVEYCRSVPEYFFQTKSKKKRIFTGLLVSN